MPVFNILLLAPLMFFSSPHFWHFYDLQLHSKWAHVIMSSNFIDKKKKPLFPVAFGQAILLLIILFFPQIM